MQRVGRIEHRGSLSRFRSVLGPGWKRWARIATWMTVRFKVRGDERVLTTAVVSYGGDFEDDHPRARRNGTRIEYDPQGPEKAGSWGSLVTGSIGSSPGWSSRS